MRYHSLTLLLALQLSAIAADQTEYLKLTPKLIPSPSTYVNVDSATMTYAQAHNFVAAMLPAADLDDPDFYCMIHVLRWGTDATKTDKANWYLYRGRGSSMTASGKWTPDRFRAKRIYGSHNIALLYLHVNVPIRKDDSVLRDELKDQAFQALVANDIAGGITVDAAERTKLQTQAEQIVKDQIPADHADVKAQSDRGAALVYNGEYLVEQDYLGVSYQIDVVKKLPAPVQNLSDALGLLQAAAAPNLKVKMERGGLSTGAIFEIVDVPSDITVTGKLTVGSGLTSKTVELGSSTYDNEGLYYWDVSLGIPINTVKQLDFSTSNNTVFAKEVDKQNLFAMLNIFFRPVDTKNLQYRLIPNPLVGIALSKRPLDKVFVGLSVGVNKAQVFGGVLFNRVQDPAHLTAGQMATDGQLQSDLRYRYERKLQIGLNVPVRQVVDFLKKKK